MKGEFLGCITYACFGNIQTKIVRSGIFQKADEKIYTNVESHNQIVRLQDKCHAILVEKRHGSQLSTIRRTENNHVSQLFNWFSPEGLQIHHAAA